MEWVGNAVVHMRGLAVIAAAASAWVLVSGLPAGSLRRSLRLPSMRASAAAVGTGCVVAVGAYGITGIVSLSLALAALAAATPLALHAERERKSHGEIRDRWPDVLMYVESSLAAGSTLGDATVDAMSKVGAPFDRYAEHLRREIAFGGGYSAGLGVVRSEVSDPTTDTVVTTLINAHRSGGRRVSATVSALTVATGDDIRLRKAHDASLTEQRWTVNVALVAPWILLCLALLTNPQAAEAFSSAEASVVVAVGFAATSLGWLLARRTARLSQAPRVFK